jgi:hypothetical protein
MTMLIQQRKVNGNPRCANGAHTKARTRWPWPEPQEFDWT